MIANLFPFDIEEIVMRRALIALLSVLIVGCSESTPSELAELVIRTQFRDVPPDSVACISVDGHDAGQHLLASLTNIGVKVVPESACEYVANPAQGSYEIHTRQKAVLVYITTRLDKGEVEYLSRYHAKWAMNIVLRIHQENGAWRIVDVVKREAA
jgi:hypothetical protein